MSITREVVGATEFLHITMPVKERPESHKGYFLVTTREPLPEDSMELRLAMNFWMNSMKGANLQSKDMPALKENKSVLLIQRVELLELKKHGDHFMVDVLIPSELGSRSYLVFDFKPHGGARVMDGGLWLTYDLPSIIRAQLDSK